MAPLSRQGLIVRSAATSRFARRGFLSHALEGRAVGLLIDELAGFGVSLGPLPGSGILDLRPVADGADSTSFWRIDRHVASVTWKVCVHGRRAFSTKAARSTCG